MRKIKFRGKKVDNREWIYGQLVVIDDKFYIVNDFFIDDTHEDAFERTIFTITSFKYYEVNSETIGQFIGLYDKNNRKIYEGDIVKLTIYYNTNKDKKEEYIGIILFDDKFLMFGVKIVKVIQILDDDYCFNDSIVGNFYNLEDWWDEIEIIGNIYDNFELVKEV